MSKANLTMEELYVLMNGNIVPALVAPDAWPDWLDACQTELSDYIAAQLGPKIVLKKYDPDDQTPFWNWWMLQFKAFVAANAYEFSKKYALLGIEYDAGQGKGYHKKVDDDFTHGKKVEFKPGSSYTTTHTNDKNTHSERTYDDNTITPISEDEATGSRSVAPTGYDQTSRSGFDNTENSGKDQRDLEEQYDETLSPFEYLEGEKRVAAWSYLIELAERLTSAVCYAQWEV